MVSMILPPQHAMHAGVTWPHINDSRLTIIIINCLSMLGHMVPPSPTYQYTSDLIKLASMKDQEGDMADPRLADVTTPLNHQAWARCLQYYPGRIFTQYILDGIRNGFQIGFNRSQPLKLTKQNMLSARQHPQVIEKYLKEECSLGQLQGPFRPEQLSPQVHLSRIGVIPKRHQENKWRLTVDLLFPDGGSANDGIQPDLCSLEYTKIEQVVRNITQVGSGTMLAKVDIKVPTEWSLFTQLIGIC